MKRIINYLFVSILVLLPFCVSAKDSVKITDVKMLEKSDYTDIVDEATYEGLNINFNVKFNKEKDYIVYKVIIKNEDNEDYELTGSNDFSASKYIEYKVDYTGGNVIKANSTKEATITITYAHEVDSNKFVNGRFEEPNKFTISLSNNKRIANPKTGGIIVIIGVILGLLILGSVVAIKGNTRTKLMSILIGLLILPITTFALTKLTITVNSKVVIEKEAEFCVTAYDYDNDDYVQENLKFEPGMTWSDYLDSSLNTKFYSLNDVVQYDVVAPNYYHVPYVFASPEYMVCYKNRKLSKKVAFSKTAMEDAMEDPCSGYYHETIGPDSLIKPKSVGCYLTSFMSTEANGLK